MLNTFFTCIKDRFFYLAVKMTFNFKHLNLDLKYAEVILIFFSLVAHSHANIALKVIHIMYVGKK